MRNFRLELVPRAPKDAIKYLLDYIAEEIHDAGGAVTINKYEIILEICEVLQIAEEEYFGEAQGAPYGKQISEMLASTRHGIEQARSINKSINALRAVVRREEIKEYFKNHNKTSNSPSDPVFILSEDDIKRVTSLASEMKDIIHASNYFTPDHKRRLVDRVSQIETEIHKRAGRLDVILAGIVDVGDAFGQFGEKVKPLFDRIREIRGIAQGKSDEYAKLPPPDDVKRLPAPDKKTDAA